MKREENKLGQLKPKNIIGKYELFAMNRTEKKQTMKNKHELYITLNYLYDEGSKTNEYTKEQILAIGEAIDILENKYLKETEKE